MMNLKLLNNILLGLILLINGYIIAAPLLPRAGYYVSARIFPTSRPDTDAEYSRIDRSQNHLLIPGIALNQPVLSGSDPKLVDKGIWHRPKTSTPDKGSNTVVAGHRYTYHGSAVFYNLDKVRPKDKMVLAWSGKVYLYQVERVLIVPPNTPSVEAASPQKQLTVYTCTPLWSAKDRLVIVGVLKKVL